MQQEVPGFERKCVMAEETKAEDDKHKSFS
jgi:hypothetical protein